MQGTEKEERAKKKAMRLYNKEDMTALVRNMEGRDNRELFV